MCCAARGAQRGRRPLRTGAPMTPCVKGSNPVDPGRDLLYQATTLRVQRRAMAALGSHVHRGCGGTRG
eukprot:scaffold69621_cov30-Phaeocystis_antarctica.AAC.1